MMLLRARSRDTYRIYSEEEFLSGAGSEQPFEPVGPEEPLGLIALASSRRRLRRLAGVAMLAGAVGTAGGVVAVDPLSPHRAVARKARGSSHPTTRPNADARPYLMRKARSVRLYLAASRLLTSFARGPRRGHGERPQRWRAAGRPAHPAVKRSVARAVGAHVPVAGRSSVSAPVDAPRPERVEFSFEH